MDHPPLTVPLKEAARPFVATSFLMSDSINKKGEQENFTPRKIFGFKHTITALYPMSYIEVVSNKRSRYLC